MESAKVGPNQGRIANENEKDEPVVVMNELHNDDGDDKDYDDPNDAKNNDDEEITCPLFMEGLPHNFASHPHLAAIASLLLDENNHDDDDDTTNDRNAVVMMNESTSTQQRRPAASSTKKQVPAKKGGSSKTKHHHHHHPSLHRRHEPSTLSKEKDTTKSTTTVGETQLFLNMWKLQPVLPVTAENNMVIGACTILIFVVITADSGGPQVTNASVVWGRDKISQPRECRSIVKVLSLVPDDTTR